MKVQWQLVQPFMEPVRVAMVLQDKAALDEGIAILGQAAESFEAASKAAE